MAVKSTGVEAQKLDVTICRGSTGSAQTFTLRPNGFLRIGRGVGNDLVLDFLGVSVYHAELHLLPRSVGEDGQQIPQCLCVRDVSKNGTAVRSGPHAEGEGVTTWEVLKTGALRVVQHGWQVMMPVNSRKNQKQQKTIDRLLTIYVGKKVPPAAPADSLMTLSGKRASPMRIPIARGNSKKAALTQHLITPSAEKPKGVEEEDQEEAEGELEDEAVDKNRDRREKKDKKKKKDKKEKKKKDGRRIRGDDEEAFEEEEPEAKRKEREERERLERELQDELAMELDRKVAKKITAPASAEYDAESSVAVLAPTEAANDDLDDEVSDKPAPDGEEEDEIQAAWGRALHAGTTTTPAAPAVVQETKAAVVAPTTTETTEDVPAAVEVFGSETAAGIFVRYGLKGGKPLYRRLKDEEDPVFLFFKDGNGDRSLAGWYVAHAPSQAGDSDDYLEFWNTPSALPAKGNGDSGAHMEARLQLDGPALEALAALPEKLRGQVRAAFTAASSGTPLPESELFPPKVSASRGIPEEDTTEAVPADLEGVPPWKRRQLIRSRGEAATEAEKPADDEERPEEAAAEEVAPEPPVAEQEKTVFEVSEATVAEAEVEAPPEPPAEAGESMEVDTQQEVPPPPPAEEKPTEMESAEVTMDSAQPDETEAPVESVAPIPTEKVTEAAAMHSSELAASEVPEAVPPAPEVVADDDQADRESLPSRCSFTTNPQKTVPGGDRGESMAPTNFERAESSVGGEDIGYSKVSTKPFSSGLGALTAEALARHTEALAKAQAEAYAATFASARSNYAKSIAGRSIAGKSIAAISIAGRSIAGRSIAGRSVAGRSIAASGIAPSEKTFRTHMTTREMLVGPSQMREIMRSVSPISEPGVPIKRRRRKRDRSGSESEGRRKRKKEKKKEKAAKRAVSLHPRASSPSHYAAPSPTPFHGPSVTPFGRGQDLPSVELEEVTLKRKKVKDKDKKEKKKAGKKP